MKIRANGDLRISEKGDPALGRVISKADGSPFRIMGFTDSHLDDFPDRYVYTMKAMEQAVAQEQPDLILFLGDTVVGRDNGGRLEDFCTRMERLGIYWCPILGNREGDNPESVTRAYIALCEYETPICLLQPAIPAMRAGREVEAGCCWEYGCRREEECPSFHNSGMFQAMLEGGSTHAYFCGHDHVNDYIVKYKGITLGYNLPSGYSSYNVISRRDRISVGKTDKLLTGYTMYTFEKGKELGIQSVYYDDIFPELREEVRKVIRK